MYSPREDSFFLSEILKKYLKHRDKSIKILDTKKIPIKNFQGAQESFRILDIGTGSGIQAETCISSGFNSILASDIDSEALKLVREKKIKAVKSNLFSKINGKFGLIIFNPPYLLENSHDRKKDTTGGKKGDETILKFLKQAKTHLAKDGAILLLLSSLTSHKRVEELIKDNYKAKRRAEKNLFFEKLEILELRLK